jgi:hypothetical protein
MGPFPLPAEGQGTWSGPWPAQDRKSTTTAWPSPRAGVALGGIKGHPVRGTLIGPFFFLQLVPCIAFASPLTL